ncbi:hypothetical protein ACOME3_003363 [Neoechinorhynchus agilis]
MCSIELEVVDFEKAKELIKTKDKVVVEFFASWCQKCKMLGKMLADMKAKYPDVEIVKVDGGSDEVQEFFELDHFPTVIAYRSGQKVDSTSKDEERHCVLTYACKMINCVRVVRRLNAMVFGLKLNRSKKSKPVGQWSTYSTVTEEMESHLDDFWNDLYRGKRSRKSCDEKESPNKCKINYNQFEVLKLKMHQSVSNLMTATLFAKLCSMDESRGEFVVKVDDLFA